MYLSHANKWGKNVHIIKGQFTQIKSIVMYYLWYLAMQIYLI